MSFYHHARTFCGKPEPLNSIQYSDVFVTYHDGFNMHTGQPNPESITNENISGKRISDNIKQHYNFPALNGSKNVEPMD